MTTAAQSKIDPLFEKEIMERCPVYLLCSKSALLFISKSEAKVFEELKQQGIDWPIAPTINTEIDLEKGTCESDDEGFYKFIFSRLKKVKKIESDTDVINFNIEKTLKKFLKLAEKIENFNERLSKLKKHKNELDNAENLWDIRIKELKEIKKALEDYLKNKEKEKEIKEQTGRTIEQQIDYETKALNEFRKFNSQLQKFLTADAKKIDNIIDSTTLEENQKKATELLIDLEKGKKNFTDIYDDYGFNLIVTYVADFDEFNKPLKKLIKILNTVPDNYDLVEFKDAPDLPITKKFQSICNNIVKSGEELNEEANQVDEAIDETQKVAQNTEENAEANIKNLINQEKGHTIKSLVQVIEKIYTDEYEKSGNKEVLDYVSASRRKLLNAANIQPNKID